MTQGAIVEITSDVGVSETESWRLAPFHRMGTSDCGLYRGFRNPVMAIGPIPFHLLWERVPVDCIGVSETEAVNYIGVSETMGALTVGVSETEAVDCIGVSETVQGRTLGVSETQVSEKMREMGILKKNCLA